MGIMYFIAKTPLGQFKSVVYSDNESENEIVRESITKSLHLVTRLHFDCELEDGNGTVTVSLGSDVIKNSVFIIVE